MSKSSRRGRVFSDWLRNAFGQTIAAPYSVRRRPHAPISTPLNWDEVDPKLDPAKFNLLTIERRLKAKNPWPDFGGAARRCRTGKTWLFDRLVIFLPSER